MKRRLLSLLHEEHGQTAILAAVCLMVIVCFLGLAIDIGHLRLARRDLQTAADATALAGGLELRICGTVPNCPAMQKATQTALTEQGYTGFTTMTNCSATAGSGLTMMINNPPCALGAKDPNEGNARFVETVLSKSYPTYFARLVGYNDVTISARAEAMRNPRPGCIYALDPTGAGAITVLASIAVTVECDVVDESSSTSALNCAVGLGISAPKIAVHGGATGLLCGANSTPVTHVPNPVPADPLAYLPTPTVGSCGSSTASPYTGSSKQVNIILGGNYVFNPGTYCGGIAMTAALAAHITFNPGTYVFKPGTGLLGATTGGLSLTLSALSSISGSGVTFYTVGPQGSFSITAPATAGLSSFNLTAPTSGTYGGILFFQDAGDTNADTFAVSLLAGNKLDGAIYVPGASVNYAVGAISSDYTLLVAKDITFTGAVASTFGNKYASLTIGSPLYGDADVLVQ